MGRLLSRNNSIWTEQLKKTIKSMVSNPGSLTGIIMTMFLNYDVLHYLLFIPVLIL